MVFPFWCRHATMICCYYQIKLMNNIKVRKPCLHHRWLHWNGFWATQIFAQKFHTLMDYRDWTRMEKSPQHEICKQIAMDSLALVWAIQSINRNPNAMTETNEPVHRTVSNRLANFSTIFPNSMESRSDHLAYQKRNAFQIRTLTCWKNVNYFCTNIGYGPISFADIERQWSEFNKFQEEKNQRNSNYSQR